MKHIVFLIAYMYFLYHDIKKKEIDITAIGIYGLIALITSYLCKKEVSMTNFIDICCSIGFGLTIYMLSYFSEEGIGIADGMFFVINGFLLSLKENLLLFLTGLMVAFIIGIVMFLFLDKKNNRNTMLPFIPCCLPAIIGYIICIV